MSKSTNLIDATWNPGANGIVYSLVVSGTDLYVGGSFTGIGGQTRNRIAKISTATALADAAWNPDASGNIFSLALSGTDLYVGGFFSSIGGQTRNHIAKLSTMGTGMADAVWNPNANGVVYSLAQSGTNLYVGGVFSSIGGQTRNRIAKLGTTGAGIADATWNPDPNNTVLSLVLSGTDLYVGGNFTFIGGQTRNRIAKLGTTGTGTADAAWNPNANSDVRTLTLSGTDLYVGGFFSSIGGQTRSHIAKLGTTGTGTADPIWNPNPNNYVYCIIQSGANVYLGGNFTSIQGINAYSFAVVPTSLKIIQAISFSSLSTRFFGGSAFTLFATGGTSGNPVTFTSSNPAVATISGNTVTIIGVGTSIITASQSGNATYNAAADVAQILTVNKGSQTITFSLGANATKTIGSPAFTLSATGGASGNPVTYTSSNPTVATISGSTVTIVGIGTATITASQAGNANYNVGVDVAQILTVNKAFQSITFSLGANANKTIGSPAFTLSATGGASGNPVTYTSSNPAVATISENTVTIVGIGITNITASQLGNADYNAAADIAQTMTVTKISQAITFSLGADANKILGGAPFALTGTASSGLPVTYTSSNPAVATVSGNTVTITGAGTSIITASQLGNASYNAATNVGQTLAVNKINQTVTFVLGANDTKNVGDAPFVLSATGGASGNPITFTSSNPAVATVTGNTVTIVGVGTATITASQLGNATYNAAANVSQTLTVNKINQTVTFVLGANDSKTFGDASFALISTASSGLAPTYASSNAAVATISGNTVTIVGAGTSTIIAFQAGNANYNSATSAAQILTVGKAGQTITFSLGANAVKYTGDAPFTLSAMGGVSGNPLIYNSSNPSVATISGNTVTIIGAGRTTITASQAGNANYNDADNVTQTLTVGSLVTALEDLEDTDILVYPNPATDLLTIDVGDAKDFNIAIIDSEAKLVSSGISTQGNGLISVSVSQLPAGIYTLQISKNGETTNKRFVKQ